MQKIRQLSTFNWRLFFALCALALVPAIYQTVKTFLISSVSQETAFDIIGQMEWFDLINETLQAFLIIPLYSILNKTLSYDESEFANRTFITGILSFVIYALFSAGILIYGSVLVQKMNPAEADLTVTNRYLQLETIAFMIGIVISFVNVVFVVAGMTKNVYIFLFARTVFTIITDFIFIPYSGIYGAAVSNIVSNTLLSIISVFILYRQKLIKFCKIRKTDLTIVKEWCKTGIFSGFQQFIDNFIYAVMVCKMVNAVAEQGNYWIANNFIWGWLLIPVTAMAEIIRKDCKDGYKNLKQFNYYFIVILTVLSWAITVPLWPIFFRYTENLNNYNEIFSITLKLAPFYIAYAGSAIIDNIFIGLGKTIYNAVNSLIINLIYYAIFFILYKTGVLSFSLDVIIIMFGLGMAVHFVVSFIEEKFFLRKSEFKKPESAEQRNKY